jgi:hypothetical protein
MKSKYSLIVLLVILSFLIWGCEPSGGGGGGGGVTTQVSVEIVSPQPPTVEAIDDTSELVSLTAVLSEIEGEVIAKQVDEDNFYEVANGFVLNSLGQVSTGYEARVRLDISDGSIIRLGANAVFTLDYGEETTEGTNTKLELDLGQIWLILKGGSIDVDTESGVASIRGSYGGVSVSPTGEVYFTCFEGRCYIATATGVFYITAGETILISGLLSDPVPGYMTQDEIDEFMKINPEAEAAYAAHQAAVDSREPDDDLDGVPNTIDECPDEGDIGFGVDDVGCPNAPPPGDFDSDGVDNALDDCPYLGDLGYGIDASGCPNPPQDSDGDGYPDDVDSCDGEGSTGFGVDAYGCPRSNPDEDGDGVLNEDDLCPDDGDEGYGVDKNGCPNQPPATIDFDIDGDGIPNNDDQCPARGDEGYGLKPNGCPKPPKDSDGDGVYDLDDDCPNSGVKGQVDENGCPTCPDDDGDGVCNDVDQCNWPGETDYGCGVYTNGCPVEPCPPATQQFQQ